MNLTLFSSFDPAISPSLTAPGEIHIWLLPIHNSNLEGTDFKYLSLEEQKRAARFSKPEDRQRYLMSHAALRRILASYLACPPQDLIFSSNEYGKPFLSYPHGRQHRPVHFSLSHSGEYAALAFSASSPVGIDIEKVRSSVKSLAIAERFYHPEEAGRLASLPSQARTSYFFQLWTLREAFLKGLGTGFHTAPDSFCISPSQTADLFLITESAVDAAQWKLRSISAPDGYFCSLAYQES